MLIDKKPFYQATLIKFNKDKDLAMIEVKGLNFNYNKIKIGKFMDTKEGEPVFAIGHPNELIWSFTDGRVSSIRPNWSWKYRGSNHKANVIQTTTAINPGNSGGPLFNKEKLLVGVNTFTKTGQSLNFAVSSDDLLKFLDQKPNIIKKNKTSKYIQKKKKGPTWIKKRKKKDKTNKNSVDLSNAIEKDLNKNGIVDAWCIDKNNNGIFELVYGDVNEDGVIDLAAIDENENNNFEIILIDRNANGNPDEAEIDDNEDGRTDFIAYDYNEDGEWDKFEKV